MIYGQPFQQSVRLLDTSGNPVVGVTPTVTIKQDADVWKAATNAATASDANGISTILFDAGETAGQSLGISWDPPGTEFVPMTYSSAILRLSDIAALILATPANLLATDVNGDVAANNMRGTDGASTHNAADVAALILATPANLLATDVNGDVAANNMRGTDGASTHSAADVASVILVTPANLLATGAAGEVTTDTASRDASKADVSAIPAYGDTIVRTHSSSGDTLTETITESP